MTTAVQHRLPKTSRGRHAARPDGFYEPYPAAGPVRTADGSLQVAFAGEDGRAFTYSFARLPLPGMHEDLAAAFAARTGPAGARRTLASARVTWQAMAGMLRFLASLKRPPQNLAALTRSHLERFRRHRLLTRSPLCVTNEMTEIFLLLRHADQQLQPEVRELIRQRGHHIRKDPQITGLPGYSDREYSEIVRAARRGAAQIRDRIRAAERLVTMAAADPLQLSGDERRTAGWLTEMARTGLVPARYRGGGWPHGNLPDYAARVSAAQYLFLTEQDLIPLRRTGPRRHW